MIDFLVERKNRGWSQDQMAAAIGVTRRVYQAAENGHEPRGENARKFASFFNTEVVELWPPREIASSERVA